MSQPNTPYGNGSFTQQVDVGVSWRGIKFSAGDNEILKGLSGNALPRRTLAIMGSSGAGKTTFLNALSDRLAADGKTTKIAGERFLNEVEYKRHHRTMIGYVTQDDILNPMSTPEEALSFSLRVRRGTDPQDTKERVERMLDELGLLDARDTVVGIPGMVAGLSGGERKRTNIGVELITNPKVLYLDEPTSGLDSVTSARICQLLKKLATRGRTVIFTIHQPTAECIESFDDIMLMCKGCVVYHGPFSEAVEYFEGLGYPCPDTHTPTDFFMTLLQDAQIGEILVEKWPERLAQLDAAVYPYTAAPSPPNSSFTEKYLDEYAANARSSTGIEFWELLKRAWLSVGRNKLLVGATLIQNIVFAVIVGLLFIRLQDNVTGIADRMGLLFIIITNISFSSCSAVINNFPPQKAVFIRDQQSGAYSPMLYFITMMLAELPLQLSAAMLSSVIIYFIPGLFTGASQFFTFYAISIAAQQVAVGFGLIISTAISNYMVAAGTMPMIMIPLMLVGGLFASTDRLRPYWVWLEKPSFIRAAFILITRNEFESLGSISCDAGKFGAQFCSRQPKNGVEVLSAFELNDDHGAIWIQWMILGIMFVLTRAAAIAVLYKVARTKS